MDNVDSPGGVSDPPGPPDPPVPLDPPTPRSSWRSRHVIAIVVLLALVGAGVGVQQRMVAAEWQDRSDLLTAQRDQARDQAALLASQMDDLADVLALSEGDVAALEDRIRELADEKARAEDTATTVAVERDQLADLSQRIAGALTALDTCITQLFGLLNDSVEAFNAIGRGEEVDVDPLNAAQQTTTAFCNEARAAAAAAGDASDRLGRR